MTEHVAVPRAALEHILDWHNKTPCGVGQESLDEVVFGALHAALWPPHQGCVLCAEGRTPADHALGDS